MFNEELIKERQVMVLQQLILDKTSCMKVEIDNNDDYKEKLKLKSNMELLESIYDSIDYSDVTLMNKNNKEIVIDIIENRINDLESDRQYRDNKTEDPLEKILDFIIYEYNILLNKFLVSMTEEVQCCIKKNKN